MTWPLRPASLLARAFVLLWACGHALAAEDGAPEAQAALPTVELRQFGGVVWEGVEDELLQNLRRRVSLARLKQGTSIRPERFDYFLRILPREAREALQPFGYYSPSFDIQPRSEGGEVSARIEVKLGEPVTVRQREIEISGAAKKDRALQRALNEFTPHVGEVLLHASYEDSKAAVQRLLAERGYFDAELLDARVEVTRALAAADIGLHWHGGERYRFGPISISGSPFRQGLLEPLVPFQAEDRFRQRELLELQRRLADLDYFSRIDIQPRQQLEELGEVEPAQPQRSPEAGIGIDVDLSPAPRNVYGTGISYGTDTGAGLRLSYDRRWLNAAGHKLHSDLLLGQERSIAAVSYRVPAFERFTGWWTGSVKLRDEPFANTRTKIAELELTRDARWRGNLITAGMHLQHERYDGQGDNLIYPQLSVERKVVNDPLYPTKGFYWKVTGRWGLPALGSDSAFRQVLASAAIVRGFGEHDRLLLRAEAGFTDASRFSRLPPSLRFYAGGDRSVRGYGYQELSPIVASDGRPGAPNLLTTSIEWEHMFTDEWGAAAFVDAGNAYDDKLDPAVGVGLGLRWRSPVGPIRVDIGHGLDEPHQSIRLHVQLGPTL